MAKQERVQNRKRCEFVADELERLADRYRQFAAGTVRPEDAESVKSIATTIIRELVADWL